MDISNKGHGAICSEIEPRRLIKQNTSACGLISQAKRTDVSHGNIFVTPPRPGDRCCCCHASHSQQLCPRGESITLSRTSTVAVVAGSQQHTMHHIPDKSRLQPGARGHCTLHTVSSVVFRPWAVLPCDCSCRASAWLHLMQACRISSHGSRPRP